jgi:saccharopine dehydrogenase-like NADP-dependent oxidoreductase
MWLKRLTRSNAVIERPLIVGYGGVGTLLALLLQKLGMSVAVLDQNKPKQMPEDVEFICGQIRSENDIRDALRNRDAVISCLPFHLTALVARAAHQANIHYFDPTEDVKTTDTVRALAQSANKVMVAQCGLAPGVIGIIGAHLASMFDTGTLRHLKLRVGALPKHSTGLLGYAGNWSLAGLIHEYIADCEVIAGGKRQKVPALRNEEILRIDGREYEAFTTSGGLGTMTETFEGRVGALDYKTIRYPGHLACMRLLLEDLNFRDDPDDLIRRLGKALPPDDQDCVLLHVSAAGEVDGRLRTKTFATQYNPIEIDGKTWSAILWTTATSIAAVVQMVSSRVLPQSGFVKQEGIPLPEFLRTMHGRLYAEHSPELAQLATGRAV